MGGWCANFSNYTGCWYLANSDYMGSWSGSFLIMWVLGDFYCICCMVGESAKKEKEVFVSQTKARKLPFLFKHKQSNYILR